MKATLLALLIAGCASGAANAVSDASGGGGGNGPDAKIWLDGQIEPQPDAAMPPPDAAIDAPPPIDAMVDAKPIDAFVFQDACVPQTSELLANPVFDLTPIGTGWTQAPIDPMYPDITSDGVTAQSAPYQVWLGGITGQDKGTSTVTDVVYQDVHVPANTTQLVLTGYYIVGTTENPNDQPYDTSAVALLQTNGTPIETALSLSNLSASGNATWVPFSHTFTANLSGQTVRLRLTSTNDVINLSNFFFDTFSLKATHCP